MPFGTSVFFSSIPYYNLTLTLTVSSQKHGSALVENYTFISNCLPTREHRLASTGAYLPTRIYLHVSTYTYLPTDNEAEHTSQGNRRRRLHESYLRVA